MEVFKHVDIDGDHIEIGEYDHHTTGRPWLIVRTSDGGASMHKDDVARLRDRLTQWLSVGEPVAYRIDTPVSFTADDVRDIVHQVLAEVLRLHQSPQARYEDAVPAKLCTVPGCPAFPGAAQHFEHGEPDPEPHDVGHPEPAEERCPMVRPLHAGQDDRCGHCGLRWRDHDSAGAGRPRLMNEIRPVREATSEPEYCEPCGHAWRTHWSTVGCTAQLGKNTCPCQRRDPGRCTECGRAGSHMLGCTQQVQP